MSNDTEFNRYDLADEFHVLRSCHAEIARRAEESWHSCQSSQLDFAFCEIEEIDRVRKTANKILRKIKKMKEIHDKELGRI